MYESLIVMLSGIIVYGVVYQFYVKWFDKNVIQTDPTRQTPAHMFMDGVEFFPSNRYVMLGWHWKSIAALGPVTGPALAIIWGWLPGFLWILIGNSRDVEYDLRNDLFRHLCRLSQCFYVSTRTGDLMSKLTNDLNAVRNLVGPGIMYSASTAVAMVVTVGLMLELDWRLTLLALAPLPFVSALVKIFGQKIHDRFERILPGT